MEGILKGRGYFSPILSHNNLLVEKQQLQISVVHGFIWGPLPET